MSNTLERNYEQRMVELQEQERRKEESQERSAATERVMEATETELELTMQRAQELTLTDQDCMNELAQSYLQDALEMGIEQHMLKGIVENLEVGKQKRLEAYQQLQSQLQKAA